MRCTLLETNEGIYYVAKIFMINSRYLINTSSDALYNDETHYKGIFMKTVLPTEVDYRTGEHKGLCSIYDIHLIYPQSLWEY